MGQMCFDNIPLVQKSWKSMDAIDKSEVLCKGNLNKISGYHGAVCYFLKNKYYLKSDFPFSKEQLEEDLRLLKHRMNTLRKTS